jgi:hypothetical protein
LEWCLLDWDSCHEFGRVIPSSKHLKLLQIDGIGIVPKGGVFTICNNFGLHEMCLTIFARKKIVRVRN